MSRRSFSTAVSSRSLQHPQPDTFPGTDTPSPDGERGKHVPTPRRSLQPHHICSPAHSVYPKHLRLRCPCLPRHSHPGASDSHAAPRSGSVQRLHVLSCARSCCGSSGNHLPGLPAALHARLVPHLGSGDGREVEKGARLTGCGWSCFVAVLSSFPLNWRLKKKKERKEWVLKGGEKTGRANSALLLHHRHHHHHHHERQPRQLKHQPAAS